MSLFRNGTKRHAIEQQWQRGMTRDYCYSALIAYVDAQTRPWVFTRNVNGSRVAKPLAEQRTELEHEINRVYALLDKRSKMGEKMQQEERPPEQRQKRERKVPPPEKEIPAEEEPEAQKPPKAKGKLTIADEKAYFIAEWKRIRKFIADTAARTGAIPLDSLDTMRPIQAAKALIGEGVSARTLVYAMVCHWPQASRDMAAVEAVDFLHESEDLGKEFHKLTGYVVKLARARQNVMLIGPAGTGKSHIAKQVASLIKTEAHPNGLPYGETPMTPGATRGDLLGRHTISGFIPSQFVEIYSGGGVFNFEEIDASDPSMLIVVNNALASDQLFNSANGEVYSKHPDFIAVATANTFGLGADARYTGREKLDLATIDRFRMGRVIVELDEDLAVSLMG